VPSVTSSAGSSGVALSSVTVTLSSMSVPANSIAGVVNEAEPASSTLPSDSVWAGQDTVAAFVSVDSGSPARLHS
jgi:hypothetical protein